MPQSVTLSTRTINQTAHFALLRSAFSEICNPSDWRFPVDALVPWTSASFYVEAVVFMTGAHVESRAVKVDGVDYCHITSPGYFVAQG